MPEIKKNHKHLLNRSAAAAAASFVDVISWLAGWLVWIIATMTAKSLNGNCVMNYEKNRNCR